MNKRTNERTNNGRKEGRKEGKKEGRKGGRKERLTERTNVWMNGQVTCCVPVSEVLAVALKRWREVKLASVTAVLSAAACSWSPPKGDMGGLRLPLPSAMPPRLAANWFCSLSCRKYTSGIAYLRWIATCIDTAAACSWVRTKLYREQSRLEAACPFCHALPTSTRSVLFRHLQNESIQVGLQICSDSLRALRLLLPAAGCLQRAICRERGGGGGGGCQSFVSSHHDKQHFTNVLTTLLSSCSPKEQQIMHMVPRQNKR